MTEDNLPKEDDENRNSAKNTDPSESYKKHHLPEANSKDFKNPIDSDLESKTSSTESLTKPNREVNRVIEMADKVRAELEKVIIGQEEVIELILVGLLCNGHILLEGVPGVAKTLLVKLTAKTMQCDYSRIQFTPDLMPSDIVGTSILNMKSSEFEFRKGPIFSNFILIDEINRAPAKTQSALFEVMEERQITSDNHTYSLDYPLFVIATQNPVEQEGTYKLPEAQLDRFLFKLKLGYPSLEQEVKILERFKNDFNHAVNDLINPVVSVEELKECSDTVEKLHVKPELLNYIAKIVDSTRNNGDLYLGASPRASLNILKSSKALAAINGRSFVTPDDIRDVCGPVLNHRILLSAEKELEGKTSEDVIKELVAKIEVPR